jgi:hypothetical protein
VLIQCRYRIGLCFHDVLTQRGSLAGVKVSCAYSRTFAEVSESGDHAPPQKLFEFTKVQILERAKAYAEIHKLVACWQG